MSLQKAADLPRLAEMATSRHLGVSLTDIEGEFRVDRRTVRIPGYPAGCTDNIRSVIPEYPVT
jgi:hypothetical protein